MAERKIVSLEVRGAAMSASQLARDFDRTQRRIQDRINRTMRAIDREIVPVYRAFAPTDTGNLAAGIDSRISFRASRVRISVGVQAERDGFDYVDISRFGHRTIVVMPRTKRVMTVHTRGRYAAPILRRRVAPYHPRRDWAREGTRAASTAVDAHVERLGRDIDVVLIASGRNR